MIDSHNIFAAVPRQLPVELIQTLVASENVRVERILSMGHASPAGFWFDQETREWVLLLAGAARLLFEREEAAVELRPGDYLEIPAHRRHRVDWTDPTTPTIWLAIHFPDATETRASDDPSHIR